MRFTPSLLPCHCSFSQTICDLGNIHKSVCVKLSLELLVRPNPLDLQLSLFEICLGMICPRNSGLVVWSWWLFEKARIALPKLLDAAEVMLLPSVFEAPDLFALLNLLLFCGEVT
jgi:hypothetical protein